MHSVSLSEELFSHTDHVTEIFPTERSHPSPSAQKPGANGPSRRSLALGPDPVNSHLGTAAAFQKPRTPEPEFPTWTANCKDHPAQQARTPEAQVTPVFGSDHSCVGRERLRPRPAYRLPALNPSPHANHALSQNLLLRQHKDPHPQECLILTLAGL